MQAVCQDVGTTLRPRAWADPILMEVMGSAQVLGKCRWVKVTTNCRESH